VGRPRSAPAWSYARAGVDRSAVGTALRALVDQVRYRPRPSHGRPLGRSGHYAGLVRVAGQTVAITTDTVGTKVLLAAELGRWSEVGEDMVAINVNDLAAVGARPFGFVDTISVDRPQTAVFRQLGAGLDRGLRAAGCALLGGETAVVPEVVRGWDLGGTAVGFFPRRRPVLGNAIRPGDRLVAIPSAGVHSNGYTLLRRLLAASRIDLTRPRPGGRGPVGRELLGPTRTYVGAAEAVAGDPGLVGLAHISGGGVRNLVRLQRRVRFVLDSWPDPPSLFRWIQSLGPVPDREMFQTFNMGVGFVVVVRGPTLDRTLARLRSAGVRDAVPAGEVGPGSGVDLPRWGLRYAGYA
jgi:phosphoribosylformylglycinamidine cyclo-ligase